MQIGSRATVISPFVSTNGPILSDGNLNTPLPSSELVSSYGKKVTQLMQHLKKLKNKPSQFCSTTGEFTRKFWQSLFTKELKLSQKSLQEDLKPLLSKHGFPKMEELFKQLPVTISVKTSQKCLESNLKMKKKLRSLLGRQVGAWPQDPSVFWQCTMAITKV